MITGEKPTANDEEESLCGWLKDRYGVSWQIVSSALTELLQTGNEKQANRVTEALLQMNKIDIATLE